MATESQVVAMALAALNAELEAGKQATEPSKVGTPRPQDHTTLTAVERSGGSARSGRRSTRGWQIYVFSASSMNESNVRKSLEAADRAFRNRVLAVGDERTTPIATGPARPVGPDDGWFSGSKSYTFTI